MLRIKVNATSANVCVGFDVLGIALNLANEFSFEKAKEVSFFGFEKEYCSTRSNLVYKSYEKVFSYLGEALVPVKIGFKGEIPVSRGLGSSSSLIVAGVFAANYFATKKLSEPLNAALIIDGWICTPSQMISDMACSSSDAAPTTPGSLCVKPVIALNKCTT